MWAVGFKQHFFFGFVRKLEVESGTLRKAVKGWVILPSNNWPKKGFMKGLLQLSTFSGNSYPKGDDLS